MTTLNTGNAISLLFFSRRRCTNRVVSNGLSTPLELFRCQDKGGNHCYGVRTLVNIPGNRFICEVNGQIKLADSNSVDNNIRYQFTEEHSLPNTNSNAALTDLYCVKFLLNLFSFVFFSIFQ
jgi:hypothetical protein